MRNQTRARRMTPPIWLALLVSFLGIYGMKSFYQGLTRGIWQQVLIGGVLVLVTVVFLGTPLAYVRFIMRAQKQASKEQE
jgi:drug/metabolite transporter (DMT)-like permease